MSDVVNQVRRLVELLGHQSLSVVSPALKAVSNIVTGNDSHTQAVLDCGGIAAIASLLADDDTTVQKDACWAFSNIAAGSEVS